MLSLTKNMKVSKWLLSCLFTTLLVIKAGSGVNEADRIRVDDPCAVEMQLQAGTVSDNLACVAIVEDNPPQQRPGVLQCFNITQICDGNVFCENGNDEGTGFTTPSQINCSAGIMGTFVCSPAESTELMNICDGNKDCSGGEDERFSLCKNKCKGSYYGGCPITRMCNSSTSSVTCGECFPGYVTNPSSPTGDCLPIITISFEQESYIAMEGSSQPLQVCARTTDHIKSEQQLTVNAVITQAVGATQDDYSVPSAALMDLTFTSTKTRVCINISIVDDQLVEEDESFFVSLQFSEAPGGDQVLLGKPNTTTVTIMDDDAPRFCQARNFTNFSIRFIWQRTPAGTNATFICPNNPSFSVSRECSSAGIWLDYDRRGCGTLTADLGGILSLVSENTTTSSVIGAVQNLGQVVMESANSPVDQTRANLNTTAVILDSIANYVQTQRGSNIARAIIVRESVRTVNYLLQWTPTAIDSERSSRLVESFEVISSVYAQQLPRNATRIVSFQSITLIAQRSDLEDLQFGRSVSIADEGNFTTRNEISTANTPSGSDSMFSAFTSPTISLPRSVFERVNDTNSTGLVFTLYEEPTLFPVRNNTNNSVTTTVVGSRIIAANVAERNTQTFEDLPEMVIILLPLKVGDEGVLVPGSEVCASWDFDLQGWTRRGCMTTTGENGMVTCTCNHLTNFAVLVDICSRLENCQPVNPVVDKILSFVSYIGITISIVGLILTIITMLIFKKIRQKDATVYNLQLSIALLLMLVMALVLVAISSEAVMVLYGGCVFMSVSVHYFTLVAVMWMGATALLMFQKVVLVFVRITVTQFVFVSLICWIVPIIPVLASLIVDLALGNDPSNDLIVKREGTESFCFLSHVGVFWGAFLGPILLVMVFNVIVFISVVFVLIRHVRGTFQQKQTMGYGKVLRLMFSIGGVMSLFGLTWLFAILTISVPGLREIFQILFTIFNSFQGLFIFLFFCVLNKEARDSWRELFSRGEKREPRLLKGSSSSKHTSTTAVDHTLSVPYVSATTDSKALDLPLTFNNKRVASDMSMTSPSESKPGRILGLEDVPETSTFHLAPSKPTFIT